MKKLIFIFLILLVCSPAKSLIQVDITRGNLDPLPIAVSPLHVDINSESLKDLTIKNLGEKVSEIIEKINQSSSFSNRKTFGQGR